jgi:hypothetical protein
MGSVYIEEQLYSCFPFYSPFNLKMRFKNVDKILCYELYALTSLFSGSQYIHTEIWLHDYMIFQ